MAGYSCLSDDCFWSRSCFRSVPERRAVRGTRSIARTSTARRSARPDLQPPAFFDPHTRCSPLSFQDDVLTRSTRCSSAPSSDTSHPRHEPRTCHDPQLLTRPSRPPHDLTSRPIQPPFLPPHLHACKNWSKSLQTAWLTSFFSPSLTYL